MNRFVGLGWPIRFKLIICNNNNNNNIILIKIIKNKGTMMLGEMVSCPFYNKQKLIIIWFVFAKTCQPFNHILILI